MKRLTTIRVVHYFMIGCLLSAYISCKRDGCLDSNATNYDSKAKNDDGSCQYNLSMTSSQWKDYVDWNTATTVRIQFNDDTAGLTYSYSPSSYTFTAGKPYIIKLVNPAGNASKHYLSPKTDGNYSGNFYKSVAFSKVQTANAEIKAPYFNAIKMLVSPTDSTIVEIYCVPVIPGTYEMECTIGTHSEKGMNGLFTIEGTANTSYGLDQEVATDWNSALGNDPRKSSSDLVWASRIDTTINLHEFDVDIYGYSPDTLFLQIGVAYKLSLVNDNANNGKHYYTSTDFYKTCVWRKIQDSNGEIKLDYLNAIELKSGATWVDMYVVPTVTGTWKVVCTITDHEQFGMVGAITVQ